MAEKLIVVRVAYDPEARIWYTESSDLDGLNACAGSLEELRSLLPGMITDLIEDNEPSQQHRRRDRRGRARANRYPRSGGGVTDFTKELLDRLRQAGFEFMRHGKGSHDIWRHPTRGKSVAIPHKVPSRHFARTHRTEW